MNWYKESLMKTSGRFAFHIPPILNGLVAEARKCNSFEEFEQDFVSQIKHGLYWHVTKAENFYIDLEKGPKDYSSMSLDSTPKKGKLMITSDLDRWLNEFHYIENHAVDFVYNVIDSDLWQYLNTFDSIADINTETTKEFDENVQKALLAAKQLYENYIVKHEANRRNWVAQIDMSEVPRDAYQQVNRGFGNELFVQDPSKARVTRTIPIEQAYKITEEHEAQLPQSREELLEFYNTVKEQSL